MPRINEISSKLSASHHILALGSETKCRVSFCEKNTLVSLEPEHANAKFFDFCELASSYILKKYRFAPEVIAFDPHPLFSCGKVAQYLKDRFFPKARLTPVFHHIAHASRFAIKEGINREYIALTFDGTGYGADARIWGSEFFSYSNRRFNRRAHFEYMALPGSDIAMLKPWRIALGATHKIYKKNMSKMKLPFLKGIADNDIKIVTEMIEKDFNVAYSCSAGRLFDLVSAALSIKKVIKNEAEAAVALEIEAAKFVGSVAPYPYEIKKDGSGLCIDFSLLLKDIFGMRFNSKLKQLASRRFHLTIAMAAGRICRI